MKIILATQFAAEVEPFLPSDITVVHATKDGILDGAAGDAEVFMPWGASDVRIDPVLEAAPLVRWLHTPSAGVDHLLTPTLRARSDILLTNSAGVHAIPIAEFVIGFMLQHVKHFSELRAAQAQQHWSGSLDIHELYNATLLIIGLGGIGQEVARRAAAFGMRVWGSRRTAQPVPNVERVVGPDAWRELLPDAQFVVIAAPLDAETHGMLDATALRSMRPDAYLINIARGAIINQAALIHALREGWIAGAALDVFEIEPLPTDNPLWSLPNVFLTPHCTWRSPHMPQRAAERFLENLQRYRAGMPLHNVVYRG